MPHRLFCSHLTAIRRYFRKATPPLGLSPQISRSSKFHDERPKDMPTHAASTACQQLPTRDSLSTLCEGTSNLLADGLFCAVMMPLLSPNLLVPPLMLSIFPRSLAWGLLGACIFYFFMLCILIYGWFWLLKCSQRHLQSLASYFLRLCQCPSPLTN